MFRAGRFPIRIIAGALHGDTAPQPAPHSWANTSDNHVALWIIILAAHAEWTLPVAAVDAGRTLYYYEGGRLNSR